MPSFLALLGLVIVAYLLTFPAYLLRNLYYAKRSGIPWLYIPYDQNALIWILSAVPLRPWINLNLPDWIRHRVAITIYGWEYHEGDAPFKRWAAPMGDAKTLAYVTCGRFEVNSMDPEFAVEILKRPAAFPEPDFNAIFAGRFGHNILTTNGDHWSRQRKIIAPVINERLSNVVFDETVKQTIGLIAAVLANDQESADTYELFDMMKKITIQVLSGAAMGRSVTWDNIEEKPTKGYKMTYMEAAKCVIEGFGGAILLPSWFLDNYPSWLPGHAYISEFGQACREYPLHTRDMLKEERQRQEQTGEVKSNIVSQLIKASDADKTGHSLTESEMVGNLFIFTAAGFDTTANTLSYTLAVLAREPKWQAWIFEEIDRIMPEGEELDYHTIFPKATRVMAVMLETLRMYTPLVHIPKSTSTPQVVQTSKHTYYLPANTTLYINTCSLHRDPAIWRDLNKTADEASTLDDEHVWRPSRWIVQSDGKETLYTPRRGTYMPWSFGPRNCPGMKMAQVEFTAVLLTLFRRHKIEVVPLQVPHTGKSGLGLRDETAAEISARLAQRIQDSISLATLQMNHIYDVTKQGNAEKGIQLRLSRR